MKIKCTTAFLSAAQMLLLRICMLQVGKYRYERPSEESRVEPANLGESLLTRKSRVQHRTALARSIQQALPVRRFDRNMIRTYQKITPNFYSCRHWRHREYARQLRIGSHWIIDRIIGTDRTNFVFGDYRPQPTLFSAAQNIQEQPCSRRCLSRNLGGSEDRMNAY